MKENWHDIDEFNEQLGESLDLDASWAAFRPKDKKRKPWWLFFSGVILLLSIAYFSVNSLRQENTSETTEKGSQNEKSITINNTDSKISDKFQERVNQKTTTEIKIETADNTELTTPELISSETTATTIERNNNTTSRKLEERNNSNKIISSKHSNKRKDKKLVNHNNDNIPQAASNSNNNSNIIGYTTTSTRYNSIAEKDASASTNSLIQHLSRLERITTPLLSLSQNLLIDQRLPKLVSSPTTEATEIPKTTETKIKLPWVVGIDYAISSTTRELSGNLNAFENRRLNQEDILENNSIELFIAKPLSSRISFSTGILIDNTRAKSEETIQSIEPVELEDQIIARNYKDGIELAPEKGTVTVYSTTRTKFVRYHNYTSIYIPVLVRFKLIEKNSWGLQLTGGINYQLGGKVRGETFESGLPDGQYKPLASLDYKKSGLVQGRFGLTASKNLSAQMQLRLGMLYTRDINSRRSLSGAPVEKFQQLGVRVGLARVF